MFFLSLMEIQRERVRKRKRKRRREKVSATLGRKCIDSGLMIPERYRFFPARVIYKTLRESIVWNFYIHTRTRKKLVNN